MQANTWDWKDCETDNFMDYCRDVCESEAVEAILKREPTAWLKSGA